MTSVAGGGYSLIQLNRRCFGNVGLHCGRAAEAHLNETDRKLFSDKVSFKVCVSSLNMSLSTGEEAKAELVFRSAFVHPIEDLTWEVVYVCVTP